MNLDIFFVEVPTQASSKLVFTCNTCLPLYSRNILSWKRHLSRSQDPRGVIPWEAPQLDARPIETRGSLPFTTYGLRSDHQKHWPKYFCAYHLSSNFYFHMLLFSHYIAKKCLALQNIKGRITICMIMR